MGNFTLPRGPCNFLNLRISPWEVLFFFLLCSSSLSVLSSPSRLSLSFLAGASIWGSSPCLPPSAALGRRRSDRRGVSAAQALCGCGTGALERAAPSGGRLRLGRRRSGHSGGAGAGAGVSGAGAERALERLRHTRGSGVHRSSTARPGRARVRQ
jgi:hypothetical protein